jgi:predicted ester cyclase
MALPYAESLTSAEQANLAAATRFIEGFNNDDWDAVRDVLTEDYVFHHPLGGTVQAGPEGMVKTWAGFKQLSPDSWHPIPVMIADRDYVAVLLPTYGTFTGAGEKSPPPTGGPIAYGMVNIVRLEGGKIAETWFGMDPLIEMQQMGVMSREPTRNLSQAAMANFVAFQLARPPRGADYDKVCAFNDVVVAMGPPQDDPRSKALKIDIYTFDQEEPRVVYTHRMKTKPPYGGNPAVASEISRDVVKRWFDRVHQGHSHIAIRGLASPHILVHPTGMPCEASYYGVDGVGKWLDEKWAAFGDLVVEEELVVAHGEMVAVRWTARGISTGEFMGQPATGEPIEFSGISMYRIEGVKIAEIWETRNTLGIMMQLNPEIGGGRLH